MFKVIVMWNLARLDQEIGDAIKDIRLRGYDKAAFLTGEFAWKIAEGKIKPLSVSNIADKYCPTRRDLYFYKGINKPSDLSITPTWGGKAGYLVDDYIRKVVEYARNDMEGFDNYGSLISDSDNNHQNFLDSESNRITELQTLEEGTDTAEKGDTNWLIKLLKSNGRAELAFNYLHKLLEESSSLNIEHIITDQIDISDNELKKEHIRQIGINLPAAPDFIIPEHGIVGDIKTGTDFKPHFQLTCTGYALAYENVKGEGNNINWGVIYFLPTRNPSLYVKPMTFAQVYIFPIDDYLREEFITLRNEAYNIISGKKPPAFPRENEREHCKHCRFKEYCRKQGLEVNE